MKWLGSKVYGGELYVSSGRTAFLKHWIFFDFSGVLIEDSFLHRTFFNFALNRTNTEMARGSMPFRFRPLFRIVKNVNHVLAAGTLSSLFFSHSNSCRFTNSILYSVGRSSLCWKDHFSWSIITFFQVLFSSQYLQVLKDPIFGKNHLRKNPKTTFWQLF